MTLPGPDSDTTATLAERLVIAPRLIAPEEAAKTVAAWRAELGADDRAALEALLDAYPLLPTVLQSLSESSPFLWELASREPDRLLRLLKSDPDRGFTRLLSETARSSSDEKSVERTLDQLRHGESNDGVADAMVLVGEQKIEGQAA